MAQRIIAFLLDQPQKEAAFLAVKLQYIKPGLTKGPLCGEKPLTVLLRR